MKKLITVLAGACLLAAQSFASLVSVDFSMDTLGPKSNGFQSGSTALMSFNDTVGSDLLLYSGIESGFQNSLVSNTDFDQSGLEFVAASQIFGLSMRFGNDLGTGNAILTAFNGMTQVAQSTVAFNGNSVSDQSISVAFAGGFNRAVLVYDNGTPGGRAELVTGIQFETVPEPMTMTVLALGALAAHRRRHKKA